MAGQRLVVLGTGAVGGYFGGRLAAAGEDVFFLARGAHLAALRERGLVCEGRTPFSVRVAASDRAADAGRADVLLVCVKAYDTREAAEPCRAIVAPDGIVVTLQNGLGNVETLSEIFGADRVVSGVARVGAEVVAPGRIAHAAGGLVILGPPSPRVEALRGRFARAGVACEVTADIRQAIWEKLLANAVFNVIGAAHGIDLGELVDGPLRPTAERAIEELLAVARAKGIEIRPSTIDGCWDWCRRHPTFPTSTQQDVARGRRTEWEALSGALVAEARASGVAVPTHESLCALLRRRTEDGMLKRA
jgi:2-dehydropantoate 2-reductase